MHIPPTQFAALDPRNGKGYGKQEIPSEKDTDLQDFVRKIRNAKDFSDSLSEQPAGSWRILNAFAERMASLAVRRQDAREVRDGLIAIQVALSLTDDPRDALPVLSLLVHACRLIGADAVTETMAATDITGSEAGEVLRQFLDRSPEDQSIQAMGYEESSDAAGFRFKRNW
ncbi:hypothetical protein [Streptomyces sp. NPDC048361]|uniref:hypothetical protein n=1 Tax=Streptomyces sp. NPDC048361 TaxID=3154720 RepID=UPI00342BD1C0